MAIWDQLANLQDAAEAIQARIDRSNEELTDRIDRLEAYMENRLHFLECRLTPGRSGDLQKGGLRG